MLFSRGVSRWQDSNISKLCRCKHFDNAVEQSQTSTACLQKQTCAATWSEQNKKSRQLGGVHCAHCAHSSQTRSRRASQTHRLQHEQPGRSCRKPDRSANRMQLTYVTAYPHQKPKTGGPTTAKQGCRVLRTNKDRPTQKACEACEAVEYIIV